MRGSTCRWYRVLAVGPSQITEDRNSLKSTVGDRAVGILRGENMLWEMWLIKIMAVLHTFVFLCYKYAELDVMFRFVHMQPSSGFFILQVLCVCVCVEDKNHKLLPIMSETCC